MSLATELIEGAPGKVFEFAGLALPSGFLWANGQAVSRTAYPRLFAAITASVTGSTTNGNATVSAVSQDLTALPISIVGAPVSGSGVPAGTTVSGVTSNTITLSQNATASASGVAIIIAPYGIGDGSTTFNVPDRRGRAGVGHDLMGTSAAGRLTTGGGGVNGALLGHAAGAESHTLTVAEIPAHTHNLSVAGAGTAAGSNPQFYQGTNAVGAGQNTSSIGSGSAHAIMQPSIVMNYIIKT